MKIKTEPLGYEVGKPWGNVSIWVTDINIARAIRKEWQQEYEKDSTPPATEEKK